MKNIKTYNSMRPIDQPLKTLVKDPNFDKPLSELNKDFSKKANITFNFKIYSGKIK